MLHSHGLCFLSIVRKRRRLLAGGYLKGNYSWQPSSVLLPTRPSLQHSSPQASLAFQRVPSLATDQTPCTVGPAMIISTAGEATTCCTATPATTPYWAIPATTILTAETVPITSTAKPAMTRS